MRISVATGGHSNSRNEKGRRTALAKSLGFGIILASLSACALGNSQPRTVDAAMAQFHGDQFKVGTTTKNQIKGELGSPSEMKNLGSGREQWTYSKVVEVSLFTVTTDTGTNYLADYTFAKNGVLENANYRAVAAGNPLLK